MVDPVNDGKFWIRRLQLICFRDSGKATTNDQDLSRGSVSSKFKITNCYYRSRD